MSEMNHEIPENGTGADRKQDAVYSWVNPRIRQEENGTDGHANPWGGGEDAGFWRTADPRGNEQTSRQDWQRGESGQYAGRPGDRSRQNLAGAHESVQADRSRKAGRGWGKIIAMALVFGLVAGLTGYGVNFAANRVYPVSAPQTDGGQAQQKAQLSQTDTVPGPDSKEESGAAGEGASEEKTSGTDASVPGMTVADVTANSMPSMVTISTMSVMEMQSFFGGSQKYTAQGAGTGIIVGQNDTDLLIATNNHVVEGATQLSVGFIDEAAVEAVVKGTDSETDLAIIAAKLEDISDDTMKQIKIATIGDSDDLRLGEQIVAIGNALGYGQSVTSGYVSAFGRELNLTDGINTFTSSDLIQVDAAINSGNSGGALLNMRGELVGINEAKSSMTSSGATVDNVGYAIPINKAQPILEELMSEAARERYSEEKQGYLGVTCANVTSEYAEMYGMPEGVCFTSVVEDGPAGAAGIQKGDVLTSLDGKTVRTYEKLLDRLTYYKAGDTVEVVILRADNGEYKEHTMTVTLGSREVLDAAAEQALEDN